MTVYIGQGIAHTEGIFMTGLRTAKERETGKYTHKKPMESPLYLDRGGIGELMLFYSNK